MSLVILTKSPEYSIREFWNTCKVCLKILIGRTRGPDSVNSSLLKGLDSLGVTYQHNPKASEISSGDIVYVNVSVEALKWLIQAKRNNKIQKLIVGPNITILPSDHDSLMLAPEIDRILFPSQWTKDYWSSLEKQLEPKINIWPAGVDIPTLHESNREFVLVYYKNAPRSLLTFIQNFFEERGVAYKVIEYGKYDQRDYFSLLQKAKMTIFLSESESQGLAMFESWAYNVPTLVWNRGYWKHTHYTWQDPKISSPYLTDSSGMFFKDENDFGKIYENFAERVTTFHAREYVMENFTHEKIAKLFIKLINES